MNEDTEDDAKCDENEDEFILDGYEASFHSNWKIGSSDKTSAGKYLFSYTCGTLYQVEPLFNENSQTFWLKISCQ